MSSAEERKKKRQEYIDREDKRKQEKDENLRKKLAEMYGDKKYRNIDL